MVALNYAITHYFWTIIIALNDIEDMRTIPHSKHDHMDKILTTFVHFLYSNLCPLLSVWVVDWSNVETFNSLFTFNMVCSLDSRIFFYFLIQLPSGLSLRS